MMAKKFRFGSFSAVLSVLVLLWATDSAAQTGTLRGTNSILTNAAGKTITLQLPGAPTSTTIKLPAAPSTGVEYLYNDGNGNTYWGVPVSTASTAVVLYNSNAIQTIPSNQTGLFNVQYVASDVGTAPGAMINVPGSGPSASTYSGLDVTGVNIQSSTITGGTTYGLTDTVANSGSGTQTGLSVTVSGTGTNYTVLANGGNVGINTVAPTEQLEVSGNIRISGQKGLHITEWNGTAVTAGTMGTGVLANVGGLAQVVIQTTSVTSTSRIILTAQDNGGNAANVGTPYVTARGANTFTIQSTNNADRSTIAWIIIEP
jgi:hypothetical protein